MQLYHGGHAIQPKVATQKELGVHCSPSALEADAHAKPYVTKCDADVSGALLCEDMNDWGTLEAFTQLLKEAGESNAAGIAARIWRENDVPQNSPEASAVIRDVLVNEYGIECIQYFDAHEIPGAECYILLTDHKFEAVWDLDEAYPNLAAANDYLAEDQKIYFLSVSPIPQYTAAGAATDVPHELFIQSPKDIAARIVELIDSASATRDDVSQKAQVLADLISKDYSYAVDASEGTICVFIQNNRWADKRNPKIAIRGKSTQLNRVFNQLSIPENKDITELYVRKVKPFLDNQL